ncbi:MAG: sensor histidine kinase [Thermoguttaceae bacterium]
MDFARPREPVLAEVDFQRLVDDALLVVQPRANQQEVEVIRSIASELPTVHGDMRQLGEAIVNLLVNALDAMPDGGRLSIAVCPHQTGPQPDSPRWVRIDVRDTGPGIRPSELERLFEPFFTTKAAGSGLGLVIVQQTAERHGGTVTVQTRPGEGALFSIILPAANP